MSSSSELLSKYHESKFHPKVKKSFKSNILRYKSASFVWPTHFHVHLSFIPSPVLYYSTFCSIFTVICCSENYGKNDINWTLRYKKSGWSQILAVFCLKPKKNNCTVMTVTQHSWVANKTIWLFCTVFLLGAIMPSKDSFANVVLVKCSCLCLSIMYLLHDLFSVCVCSLWQALPWWWAVMGWSFMPPQLLWTIWDFIRWVEHLNYIFDVQCCE